MKVCLCLECMDVNGGGPSRSVPALAKSLDAIDVSVTILTARSQTNNIHSLIGTNVNVIEIDSNKEIYSVLNADFDIIHTQGLWIPFYHYVTKVAKKLNIPLLVTPRGTLEPHCLSVKKWKKKIAMALYQKSDLNTADCLLATADMEAEHFKLLGLNNPIAVIPNGLDVLSYPLRKIAHPKKQILFLSRLSPKKGIPLLLEAWSQLANDYPEWSLLIVGNGESLYINQLNEEIKSHGIVSSVKIHSPAFGEEKYRLYCESSLFVLPTYSENFGMVIAEAMSCGIPVITTKGTPWEILNTRNAGWWIDLSVKNLRETLSNAMSLSEEELIHKGIIGNQIILDEFTNDSVAAKMKLLYSYLIDDSEENRKKVKSLLR